MNTLTELIGRHGVNVDEHLDREALVPVNAGIQRQGDVIVIPLAEAGAKAPTFEKKDQLQPTGFPVVRGENGGNTHLLLADGDVAYREVETTFRGGDTAGALALGVLKVAEGATAYLAHPEHGYLGIAPGTYQIRRQREQADEIRLVQD